MSDDNNSGCFNGLLRKLLCTGNVPTHPSDCISESSLTQLTNPLKISNPISRPRTLSSSPSASGSVTPGIVARLMGLDSLPETNWVSKGRASDLVTRSRSVSFADYLLDFELSPVSNQQHRRVRTSVSFREVPAIMNHGHQGHEFLVVYLDSVDKENEFESNVKKTEVGFGDLKQGKQGKEQRIKNREIKRENSEIIKKRNDENVVKKKKNISKLKDEPRRECGAQSSPKVGRNCKGAEGLGYSVRPHKRTVNKNGGANLKEGGGDHSPVKKMTTLKKKKVVAEPKFKKGSNQNAAKKKEAVDNSSCLENSSPVSVFDIEDILIQHETWLSEYSSPMNVKSQTPKVPYNEDPQVRAVKREICPPINDEDCGDYTELLVSRINRMTEEDLKESNWVAKNLVEFEGFEDICLDFEGLILDMLMEEAIDDFVQFL